MLQQNGGAHLCAVDDANDHTLSVWNWQKEKQLADVKVMNPQTTYTTVCMRGAAFLSISWCITAIKTSLD